MAISPRRKRLAGLIVFTVLCMACNPLAVPYFMFVGTDPKYDPDFKLAAESKNKPVKVVILTSAPLDQRMGGGLANADRDICVMFAQKLQQGAKENRENIIVASTSKVQKFKDDHPMWQSLSLEELGKRLEADYVIDLEVNHLSLYEPGSQNTLFMGQASISVAVANVNKPGEGPVFRKEYTCSYPASGSKPVSDTNPLKFRRDFLNRVATDLSWLFTSHPTSEEHNCE
jgi:hypothetical protein